MTKIVNIGDIFAVLADNSTEIVEVVNRIGLANLVRSGPAIYRIMKTVADRQQADPDVLARVERMLYYDEATMDRVRAFQRKHGLHDDGLVGDRTWSKVEELLKGGAKQ